ncbi:Hypothetical predicted protein, partial [Olea europaea subsp. europaea]
EATPPRTGRKPQNHWWRDQFRAKVCDTRSVDPQARDIFRRLALCEARAFRRLANLGSSSRAAPGSNQKRDLEIRIWPLASKAPSRVRPRRWAHEAERAVGPVFN